MRFARVPELPRVRAAASLEAVVEKMSGVQQWTHRMTAAAVEQLNDARATVSIPDVGVVIGSGNEWREAVDNIAWEPGDMLLLGSGAAGPMAQVLLGTAASKILRHAPVPIMIVPRQQTSKG